MVPFSLCSMLTVKKGMEMACFTLLHLNDGLREELERKDAKASTGYGGKRPMLKA